MTERIWPTYEQLRKHLPEGGIATKDLIESLRGDGFEMTRDEFWAHVAPLLHGEVSAYLGPQ